jgi:hypothetical protein
MSSKKSKRARYHSRNHEILFTAHYRDQSESGDVRKSVHDRRGQRPSSKGWKLRQGDSGVAGQEGNRSEWTPMRNALSPPYRQLSHCTLEIKDRGHRVDDCGTFFSWSGRRRSLVSQKIRNSFRRCKVRCGTLRRTAITSKASPA